MNHGMEWGSNFWDNPMGMTHFQTHPNPCFKMARYGQIPSMFDRWIKPFFIG